MKRMRFGSTFTQRLALSFAVLTALMVIIATIGYYAISSAVRSKDHVINVNATALIKAGEIDSAAFRMSAGGRGYWLTGDPDFVQRVEDAHHMFLQGIGELERLVETEQGRRLLDEIKRSEDNLHSTIERLDELRRGGANADTMGRRMVSDALPARNALEHATDQFVQLETRRLIDGREQSSEAAGAAKRQVLVIALLLIVVAVFLAFWLGRAVTSEVGAAVADIQSSATELQTTATQQATGAREQSTAMTEISTTMNELLASSRQIAESAQRVAGISAETANAARSGDRIVQRTNDSVSGIKRQVDMVVTHMLELGRKSQQIGGIVDVINELAEQTNILAINANIEAAGAGESGRRFSVVADEIRKLADRGGNSIKDIRSLIEEVRAAVNTTVMATETSSKAVDAATRDFADVTQSLSQIASLVTSNSEAAHEIELSTKQQTTAVEQVNGAVGNVAQASREIASSTIQALQTSSGLAQLSRRLALLIRPQALA